MSDSGSRKKASGNGDVVGDPLAGVEGMFIDPFAAAGLGEDPSALAERVAFRLWSDGDVSGRAIEQARKDAAGGARLDQVLVRQGLVDPEAAARALSEELNAPFADLDAIPATPVLGESLPAKFVGEALVLPLADDGDVLRMALADPLDDFTLRAIAMKTQRRLEIFIASADAIREAITLVYRGGAASAATEKAVEPRGRLFDAPPPSPQPEARPAPAPRSARRPVEEPRAAEPRMSAGAVDDFMGEDLGADDWMDEEPARPAPRRRAASGDRAVAQRRALSRDADRQVASRPKPSAVRFVKQHAAKASVPLPKATSQKDWAAEREYSRTQKAEVLRSSASTKKETTPTIELRLAPRQATPKAPRRDAAAPRGEETAARESAKLNIVRSARSPRAERALAAQRRGEAGAPRASGVVAPSRIRDEAEKAQSDLARPKFVRPKRVTLKDQTNAAIRAAAERMRREEAEVEIDPLAIPPMEDEGGAFDSPSGHGERAEDRRRFMRGFVGGFTGARSQAPQGGEDAAGFVESARLERDDAARRLVTSNVIAALRGDQQGADDDYEDEEFETPALRAPSSDDGGVGQGEDGPRSTLSILSGEESAQLKPHLYQVASAVAQRERRQEQAKSAEAARRAQGAAVRHSIRADNKVETPSYAGPKAVSIIADLEALGYRDNARDALEGAVRAGDGLVLICGPSGAGKTGTAMALARRCAGNDRDIERFDRPIEQRESEKPDSELVLVGAINDAEAADAAARAAMRGALVIATLDVESVAGAAPRLIAMGLPPFALASCLRAVAAQHVAPRVCTRCVGSGRAVASDACPQCSGTGVDGEVNIVEVLALDDAIRALILANAPEDAFRHAMTAAGTPTLADDAAAKVAQGITSADGAAAAAAAARA